MADGGYRGRGVVYSTPHYSAKELTVFPGRSVTIKDAAAYGLILTQGFGSIGKHDGGRRLPRQGGGLFDAALFGEGADGVPRPQRDHQRRRGLRADSDAGLRLDRQTRWRTAATAAGGWSIRRRTIRRRS